MLSNRNHIAGVDFAAIVRGQRAEQEDDLPSPIVTILSISQQSFEDSERNKKTTKEEDEEELPDPVNQLVTMFSRQAQMEQGPQEEDTLYMDYAVIMAK